MNTTIADVQREQVRAAILEIVNRHHGVLNPAAIVEVARDPNHILHDYFEWDDSAAAEAYRRAQAGALVRHLKLTFVKSDPATRTITLSTTRGFQSRPSMRRRDGGYEPIGEILRDEAKRRELLAQVLRDLMAYRQRYQALAELDPIWAAIDQTSIELEDSSATAPADEIARPGAAG